MRTLTEKEEKIVEGIFQDVVDEYQLNYGNGEITFEGTQDDPWIDQVIEAPNNTTISAYVEGLDYQALFDDESKLRNNAAIRKILACAICKAIDNWEPEDTFEELWEPGFEFSAFEFMEMLKEDKKYFDDTYKELEVEVQSLN